MKSTLEYWATSKGERILVEEMNTSHIMNSIRKIKSTPGWRDEWLSVLEDELSKRGMISRDSEFEKKMITDEEKMYFLSTSCDYQFLSYEGGSLSKVLSMNEDVMRYIKINTFCIPLGHVSEKEKFISDMDNDARKVSPNDKKGSNEFFAKYEDCLLINVFSSEWSEFMNLMLGRKHG